VYVYIGQDFKRIPRETVWYILVSCHTQTNLCHLVWVLTSTFYFTWLKVRTV